MCCYQTGCLDKIVTKIHIFLPVLDSAPPFSFSSWPRFQPTQDDWLSQCVHAVTHPEDGHVEDDDGHEADYVHPELLAADEARAIRDVTAGYGGQVNWR